MSDQELASLERQLRRLKRDIVASLASITERADPSDDAFARFESIMVATRDDWAAFMETWSSLDAGGEGGFPDAAWQNVYDQLRDEMREANAALAILRTRRATLVHLNEREATLSNQPGCSIPTLPKISIPKFSGDLLKWMTFRDTFKSLVHLNPTLSGTQKLHYLLDALSGEPAGLLSGLPLQDCSYEQAWNSLLRTYDNPRILASLFLQRLLECDASREKTAHARYSRFLISVGESIEAFRNLHLQDEANVLLSLLALRALDSETRREFETQHTSPNFPEVRDVIEYVRHRKMALTLANESLPSFEGSTKQRTLATKGRATAHPGVSLMGSRPLESSTSADSSKAAINPKSSPTQDQSCAACHGMHPLFRCPQFRRWPLCRRVDFARAWQGCQNCLRVGHKSKECPSKWSCRVCELRHHTLIHTEVTSNGSTASRATARSQALSHHAARLGGTSKEPYHVLGTAQAALQVSSSEEALLVRVLLDCGSQHSFVTSRVAKGLKIPLTPFTGSIAGLTGSPINVEGVITCTLCPIFPGSKGIEVCALVVHQIASSVPNRHLEPLTPAESPGLTLADPEFHVPGPIGFLAGVDVYHKLIIGLPARIRGTGLYKLPTVFGDVITGTAYHDLTPNKTSFLTRDDADLTKAFENFRELEEPTPADRADPEDLHCEGLFTQTLSRTNDGRYVVRLPIRPGRSSPGFNRDVALRRFYGLERKLQRDPDLLERYRVFMLEYETLGHMSLATSESDYVIPHHGVMQGQKLRVVFDASCASTGCSLNEMLYTGPKLQRDLSDILMTFRTHPIAVTCDIVKMYRQVLIHPEDCKLQHIFWRADPAQTLKEYQLNTVTYGVRSSAFHAIRVVKQVVLDHGQDYEEASRCINNSMYVDDIVSGTDTPSQALELRRELTELLSKGGFSLAKWASNCPEVIPEGSELSVLSLTDKLDTPIKVLGLRWDPRDDAFQFAVQPPQAAFTKRGVMSVIARLFDPLGFVAPVIFYAKALLQEVWKAGTNWDDPLPASCAQRWRTLVDEWPLLESVRVPRYIFSAKSQYCLVGFSDASTAGYAAAVYVRIQDRVHTGLSFLLKAKTKVAPSKFLTTAQLELCGALLLQRTMDSVVNALPPSDMRPLFFTDSTVVLAWLHTPIHQLKVFEANRVSAILSRSSREQWQHVRSNENPADIASRGRLPSQLSHDQLWWAGPSWLVQEQWLDAMPGWTLSIHETSNAAPDNTWMEGFSSLQRLVGAVGWILRWIRRCRLPMEKTSGPLTGPERKEALLRCVRQVQRTSFSLNLLASPPLRAYQDLQPFVDERGIVRVGGRIKNAAISFTHKHPALLPRKHPFAYLVTRDVHERNFHAGPTLTTALLRRELWVPGAYRLAKEIIAKCVRCRLQRARPVTPTMGDLPKDRVCFFRAFARVGVDLAGPLTIRESRRRRAPTQKTYACLFVCLASKAVHVELVSSMKTDSFLEALDRFIARRGLPSLIQSDHGTNFVGASRFIKRVFSKLHANEQSLVKHLAPMGIEWKFSPPGSPHFGGLWEAAIKSAKRLLAGTMGKEPRTYEELNTLLVRIEGLLNSRPLCPLNDDPESYDTLTPGHFLIGEPLRTVPHPTEEVPTARSRWTGYQQQIQALWERWRREYLHHLQQRTKWRKSCPNLGCGDLVIMIERRVSPGSWPVARVSEVHPGHDGVVRVVTVRTPSGQYLKRAARALAPLFEANDLTDDKLSASTALTAGKGLVI